jgi:hypothetical protein
MCDELGQHCAVFVCKYTDFEINDNDNDYSSFFIIFIYVLSQQLRGQLQTQHRVDTGNYIMEKHNIKPKINYRKLLEEKHINGEK